MFLQGNIRYKIYYSPLRCFIRKHVLQQINFRIKVMKKECYASGSCVECGCKTTALQMCSKACEGGCYPPMMNKKDWGEFISPSCRRWIKGFRIRYQAPVYLKGGVSYWRNVDPNKHKWKRWILAKKNTSNYKFKVKHKEYSNRVI